MCEQRNPSLFDSCSALSLVVSATGGGVIYLAGLGLRLVFCTVTFQKIHFK